MSADTDKWEILLVAKHVVSVLVDSVITNSLLSRPSLKTRAAMKIGRRKKLTLQQIIPVLAASLVSFVILFGAQIAGAQAPLQKLSISISSTGMPGIQLFIARENGLFREEGFEPQLIRMSANAAI